MCTGARTPEPAPVLSSSAVTLDSYACSPSPIAPLILDTFTPHLITPDPYVSDVIMWDEPMSTDYQSVVDHNTDWVYVPSLPLCINIVLNDPSTAEQAVDSRIEKACICTAKIESISSDIFTKCEHKDKIEDNGTIKWIIDSSASMAFTSIVSDFSDLIYFKEDKRPLVTTANSNAEILGFGTVFIQTTQRGDQHKITESIRYFISPI